jgi:predicted DCC family thiol-disulfide oxidoreductase YuxK
MDAKRTINTDKRLEKGTDFPPYSVCGAVPLRHIRKPERGDNDGCADNSLAALIPSLLVYDGECGFCARSIQFILRHEQRHDLLFVPRDSELGKDLRRQFHLEAVESLLWIADGEAAIESGAVLNSAKYLGGIWATLAAIGGLVPAFLRNAVYRFIARNRRRLSSSAATCLVPTAEQRARFLN